MRKTDPDPFPPADWLRVHSKSDPLTKIEDEQEVKKTSGWPRERQHSAEGGRLFLYALVLTKVNGQSKHVMAGKRSGMRKQSAR